MLSDNFCLHAVLSHVKVLHSSYLSFIPLTFYQSLLMA